MKRWKGGRKAPKSQNQKVGNMVEQSASGHSIQEMPDKETLQRFVDGMHGPPTIVFYTEEGIFKQVRPLQEMIQTRIETMPSEEMLESFLNGDVIFNTETGQFEFKIPQNPV